MSFIKRIGSSIKTSFMFERNSCFLSSRDVRRFAFAYSAIAALTVELFFVNNVSSFEHYRLSALLLGKTTDLSKRSKIIFLSSPFWKLVVYISGENA